MCTVHLNELTCLFSNEIYSHSWLDKSVRVRECMCCFTCVCHAHFGLCKLRRFAKHLPTQCFEGLSFLITPNFPTWLSYCFYFFFFFPLSSPLCSLGVCALKCWWVAPVRWAHAPRVLHGDLSKLSGRAQEFVEHGARLCQPDSIHVCDGTEKENVKILTFLESEGLIKPLAKYENW